jgi:hypothetical protein
MAGIKYPLGSGNDLSLGIGFKNQAVESGLNP